MSDSPASLGGDLSDLRSDVQAPSYPLGIPGWHDLLNRVDEMTAWEAVLRTCPAAKPPDPPWTMLASPYAETSLTLLPATHGCHAQSSSWGHGLPQRLGHAQLCLRRQLSFLEHGGGSCGRNVFRRCPVPGPSSVFVARLYKEIWIPPSITSSFPFNCAGFWKL